MRVTSIVVSVAVGCLAGCGSDGPTHVELSDKTPAQGSALAATAVCGQVVRCGSVTISCSGGSGGSTECAAAISPVDHASCYAIVQPDLERTLRCPDFTPALVDMLERCIDAAAEQPCLTQAQADAAAAQAEMGVIVDLDPPECAFMKDPNLVPGC